MGGYFTRVAVPSGTADGGFPKTLNYLPSRAASAPVNSAPANPAPPSYSGNTYSNPPPPVNNAAGNCTINGTLAVSSRDNYGNAAWKQWNNVRVELHQANGHFNARYQQYVSSGYDHKGALSAIVKEDGYWAKSTQAVTKATTMSSNRYGYGFSWFGFVNLKPGYYRVVVPGYPQLNRWVSFTAGGQKISVALEYP